MSKTLVSRHDLDADTLLQENNKLCDELAEMYNNRAECQQALVMLQQQLARIDMIQFAANQRIIVQIVGDVIAHIA